MSAADRLLDVVVEGLRAEVAADARRARRRGTSPDTEDRRSAVADALDGPARRALRHPSVAAWPALLDDAAAEVIASLWSPVLPVETLRDARTAYRVAFAAAGSVVGASARPVEVPDTVRKRAQRVERLVEDEGLSVEEAAARTGTTAETMAAARSALGSDYADPVEGADAFGSGTPLVEASPVADMARWYRLRDLNAAAEDLDAADRALLAAATERPAPTLRDLGHRFEVHPSTVHRRLRRIASWLALAVQRQAPY